MTARKLAPGLYALTGTRDADGKELLLEWRVARDRLHWTVLDSRRRVVSQHFTKADAVESVEVASGG